MNAPTITQQNNSEKIGFTRTYPLSISGLIRMGLILFQLAGFVSAASVAKYLSGRIYLPSDMNATRDAYLLFSIIGFFVSIVIYVICLFNLTKLKFLMKIQFNLICINDFMNLGCKI
ncbi:unnamed protein product [Brachionus calyciflorus]|uniref:CASP-like protein n=1 Tax=Brachionus calyciflorus TaxID=104777 RepID=A0A813YU28_9BILA|nr:unnamed protein product [Brachionus calyciflorus]